MRIDQVLMMIERRRIENREWIGEIGVSLTGKID